MRRARFGLIYVIFCLVFCPDAGQTMDVHVARDGNDANPGTEEAPLASLTAARDALRAARAGLPASALATVWIHDGVYPLTESFVLEKQDSGTSQALIQFRAKNIGKVRLIGGRTIPTDAFTEITHAETLTRLPSVAHEATRRVDLGILGITDLGTFPDIFREPQPLPELFFNGNRMTLAQWPNEGWAEIDTIIESGPAPWRNHESDAIGVFTYKEDHPARWDGVKELWLEGYWCFDWASETIRVKSVDPKTRQITLALQHPYGLGSGNPAARRFRAINLLEELDSPREYFIDREEKALYFWPPAPLTGAEIVLSILRDPLIDIQGASNLKLIGLVLEYCAGTAVRVKDGSNITVAGCEIRNAGQIGLSIEGGSGHTVLSCDIHHTGTDGIHASGGERKTLTPSHHSIANNHIFRVSERMRTGAYNIRLWGVGVSITHNHIHDAPHQAIGVSGNDHLFEFNDVHHVGMASDDCGAFYMGRNPSDRGTIIRHNYWHEIGSDMAHGSCAIYFDDGDGGQRVEGNVFYKASGGNFGAVFNHGGHGNRVENNVFIECSRALGAAPWGEARWQEFLATPEYRKLFLEEVDITRPPFTERYPELVGFLDGKGGLRMNTAARNVGVRCKNFVNGNWELDQCMVTEEDPGFVDYQHEDFNLREDSEVFQKIPGFEPVPFQKIGLYADEYRERR
ncbi:MAG: hypothetical protein HDKAJFGB_02312 [Anaerolineae bacterium]|nr:hypothetical protein [Anaerolineae bacterium]